MTSSAFDYATHDKQLRQLFELAEDNQQAVQDAIAWLVAEREAFVKERQALAKTAVNSAEVSDTLRRATAEAIPAIEQATENAVKGAMEKALGFNADVATTAWNTAATPLIERFTNAVQMANSLQDRVNNTGLRRAWLWTATALAGVAATLVVAVVGVQQIKAQQAEVQRQQAEVQQQKNELQAQKKAFSEEMARMQASVSFLEKKGGRIQLEKCGPEQRVCIEVAPDQGNGRNNFRGVWADAKNERTYVVPKGY